MSNHSPATEGQPIEEAAVKSQPVTQEVSVVMKRSCDWFTDVMFFMPFTVFAVLLVTNVMNFLADNQEIQRVLTVEHLGDGQYPQDYVEQLYADQRTSYLVAGVTVVILVAVVLAYAHTFRPVRWVEVEVEVKKPSASADEPKSAQADAPEQPASSVQGS